MKSICVIGSLNIDLVAAVERFPLPGETLTSVGYSTFFGGKGGNQAIALGLLGANVSMVGKVGGDIHGSDYIRHLRMNGVDTAGIRVEQDAATGTAMILVDPQGENQIIISPGANGLLTPSDIDECWEQLLEADIFLFQLEVPIGTVAYAIKRLKGAGKTVILDPAPASQLPDAIFKYIDYMTPNETEIKYYAGRHQQYVLQLKEAANILLRKGVNTIVAKAGADGAYLIRDVDLQHIAAYPSEPVDTTGAGDCFNAGFAYALATGSTPEEAVGIGNAVGALAIRQVGAQSAMPSKSELDTFLRQQALLRLPAVPAMPEGSDNR
ncbi:ribokinase [Paenibacillus sp. PAMC21692]|uniref:ribokinase n=1 Tax=Paenibacillus sp. PAMC21692 TaxID=2762320 RepID=UPI00164EA42D|nr:ribokinase [Paenibacillus sp. PAMC21692]QNK59075.1 ribokinase [Paenibacillus sp. PAMC21692]